MMIITDTAQRYVLRLSRFTLGGCLREETFHSQWVSGGGDVVLLFELLKSSCQIGIRRG